MTGRPDKRQIDSPAVQLADRITRHHPPEECQLDVRIPLAHCTSQRGQSTMVEHSGEADRDAAIHAAGGRPGGVARRFDILEHAIGMRQKGMATGCQGDASRTALEQWYADILFELADRLTQWGLRHLKPGGGPAEVQFLGDRDKGVSTSEFPLIPPLPTRGRRKRYITNRAQSGSPLSLLTAWSQPVRRAPVKLRRVRRNGESYSGKYARTYVWAYRGLKALVSRGGSR